MTKKIFLDTNLFIYFFKGHPLFGQKAKHFFELLKTDKFEGITSIINQIEFFSLPCTDTELAHLKDFFFGLPNLEVLDLNQEIAMTSAKLRRKYGFRTPDAIQLATAINMKADYFLSNDKQLKKCKEIKIKAL